MQILSSDPAAPFGSSPNSSSNDRSPNQEQSYAEARPSSPARSDPGVFSLETDGKDGQNNEVARAVRLSGSPNASAIDSSQEADRTDDSFQLSRSFPGAVGYLSNRWNTGSSFSTPSTLGRRSGDDSVKYATPSQIQALVSFRLTLFRLEPFSLSTCSTSTPAATVLPAPNPQSSQFRLSLSLEGKAQVIESTTPPHLPPPRPSAEALAALPPVRRPSFHRSHSAQDSVTLPPLSNLTNSLPAPSTGALPPRLTRGRSRDVHAWQFACEVDKQEDPLIAQAKHESHGSALAAISLLRSTSSSGSAVSTASPLQPSSSAKRNAAMSKAPPRTGAAKKPKLARASTSLARLQTAYPGQQKKVVRENEAVQIDITGGDKKTKFSVQISPSGNDSDKENWSPDEEGNRRHYRFNSPQSAAAPSPNNRRRRPLPSSSSSSSSSLQKQGPSSRRILQDHHQRPSLSGGSGRANTAPVSANHRHHRKGAAVVEIFEDGSSPRGLGGKENRLPVPAADDDEVERFMRGEVSPSKKGDVDAVAGLLSLSQGNWR